MIAVGKVAGLEVVQAWLKLQEIIRVQITNNDAFNSLMLVGFLKVTAPSSTVVLLLKLLLTLFVIGGGRAGGSFFTLPRRSESKRRLKD